ncbi:MAG: hypothetical protein ACI8QZ_003063 [Chlamydiales bacterium]|jgi:hypothetical protein
MQDNLNPNELDIQTPCPRSWDSLVGDSRKRFCSECSLHVHNSEALTRTEARDLVLESTERVCMRIVRDDTGAAVYRDSTTACQPAARAEGSPIRALPKAAGWILAAGASLLSACQGENSTAVDAPVDDPACTVPQTGTDGDPAQHRALLGEAVLIEELGDVEVTRDLLIENDAEEDVAKHPRAPMGRVTFQGMPPVEEFVPEETPRDADDTE